MGRQTIYSDRRLMELQDTARQQDSARANLSLLPFGRPVDVYKSSAAHWGRLHIVHTPGITLVLPRVTASDAGRCVAVKSTSGTVTVAAFPSQLIDSATSVTTQEAIFCASYDSWVRLTSISDEAWFEWNGTDLSQFDSIVEGIDAGGYANVISFRGENWIQFGNTFTYAANWSRTISVLPITQVPPTANYTMEAEVYLVTPTAAGNVIMAGFDMRFTGTAGYLYFAAVFPTSKHGEWWKHVDLSGTPTAFLGSGTAPDVPGLDIGRAMFGKAGVQGTDSGGVWLQRIEPGPYLADDDTSTPYTTRGQAGLMLASGGYPGGATVEAYYRKIKCYTI